ncbi:hypothetical protein FGO68_gene17800 [Halteria grandinella]|uniref:GED domain-containing protein n=1 Tax=Halteria grandinella TaxID=5974 RepID=A0A8J8NC16_HALGN|nr:hypothetical protein FGO68_gene17800 [Halteria grandinella]
MGSWFGGAGKAQETEAEEEQANHLQQLQYAQFRNDQDYEINKYIQSDIKPVQLPNVPNSLRTTANLGQEFHERSPRSQMEIMIIKNLITSYFNVVRKNLNDLVPKTIIAMLVNKTKNQAQRELVAQIYAANGENDFKKLLIEDEHTKRKREVCEEMVTNLTQCMEFLNEVRDYYLEEEPMRLSV